MFTSYVHSKAVAIGVIEWSNENSAWYMLCMLSPGSVGGIFFSTSVTLRNFTLPIQKL